MPHLATKFCFRPLVHFKMVAISFNTNAFIGHDNVVLDTKIVLLSILEVKIL